MTMTSTFSKALEVLPGLATDRRDWRNRLGAEWTAARSFLAPTGRLAGEIDCPYPGGDHCPRKIIHHDDGAIRAVCGDRLCETLSLPQGDVEILEIDRAKLLQAIATALDLRPAAQHLARGKISRIGTHLHQASLGVPVFLALPDPQALISAGDIHGLDRSDLPFVLLLPGDVQIPPQVSQLVTAFRGRAVRLDDALVLDEATGLSAVLPAAMLFRPEHALLGAQLDAGKATPLIPLPPGITWPAVMVTFTLDEKVVVSARNFPARTFEPSQLGLMDQRNQRANRQWSLLKAFALGGGRLPLHPKETIGGYQKQIQTLSKALQFAFGIDGSPITVEGGDYVTAFIIQDGGLSQGRQGQQLKKFR